ncbi:MAG: dockerin type I repeat-containing protein [Prevotella sp.]|nr:dockerin type I repeat-containing protein [Prevotella sp.]
MKKIFLFAFTLALMLPMATRAEASLSIEEFNILPGEEKQMLIDLTNPDTEVTTVQFDLRLPDGVKMKEGEAGYDMAGRTSWRYQNLTAITTDGITRFTLSSSGNYAINNHSGAIIKVILKADNTFVNGNISLENILISSSDETAIRQSDYTISVGLTPQVESTLYFKSKLLPIPESEQTLTIGLANTDDDITLVQFDLILPKGVALKTTTDAYDIAGRTSWRYHTLYAKASEKRLRVLMASTSNSLLAGNEGDIINIKLVVDNDVKDNEIVSMDNILLVTPDEKIIRPATVIMTMNKPTGDVNGDGTADVADISSILTQMANENPDMVADVNGDGNVDVADISFVLTIMSEMIF